MPSSRVRRVTPTAMTLYNPIAARSAAVPANPPSSCIVKRGWSSSAPTTSCMDRTSSTAWFRSTSVICDAMGPAMVLGCAVVRATTVTLEARDLGPPPVGGRRRLGSQTLPSHAADDANDDTRQSFLVGAVPDHLSADRILLVGPV